MVVGDLDVVGAAEEVDATFDRLRVSQDLLEAVPEVLDGSDIRLGFEEANLSVRDHGRLRERLPEIKIPLRGEDVARLDLQEVLHRIYDAAGYAYYIYTGEPEPLLSAEDAAWARQFLPTAAPNGASG